MPGKFPSETSVHFVFAKYEIHAPCGEEGIGPHDDRALGAHGRDRLSESLEHFSSSRREQWSNVGLPYKHRERINVRTANIQSDGGTSVRNMLQEMGL